MKKYISPEACTVMYSLEQFVATSPTIDPTESTDLGGDSKRRDIWSTEDEEFS